MSSADGAETPFTVVPLDRLRLGNSPRLGGENASHTQMLAGLDAKLPQILVHRSTMRIIDGMHRYRAAVIRGDKTIEVEFFDGSEEMAFVRAVEANIAHGLPLSYVDREAAAVRIVTSHPEWSDRAIAASTGLGARTVQAVRARVTAEQPTLNSRKGLDGRVRPLDSTDGRLSAHKLIKERPEASLREIASLAGISVSTAHDVRERVRRGEDPLPDGVRQRQPNEPSTTGRSVKGADLPIRDPVSILRSLQLDPSLRFTDTGRLLLKWLTRSMVDRDEWATLIDSIPPHCANVVAELAQGYARAWTDFSEELRERGPAG